MLNSRTSVYNPSHALQTKLRRKTNFLFLFLLLPFLSSCETMSIDNASAQSPTEKQEAGLTQQKESQKAVSGNISSETPGQATEVAAPVALDGDTLFNLLAAEFAGNSGDVEASLKYYGEAAKTIDDSRIAARSAYIALYGEDYEATIEALNRWHTLEPDAEDIPRMYAVSYLNLGQPEKAVPYIEEIFAASHESEVDEALAVKQLLAKEASTQDAYVVLEQLNGKPRQNKHLLILQSRYAAQLQNYDESLAILDQVLVLDPSMHEVLIIKSRILSAQGHHEEAALLIKQLLEEMPDNNALRLQYARMLVEQRDLKAATEQYLILHDNLPDDGEITLSLALLYIEEKRLDDAVVALNHLIEIDKKISVANYYLGRIAQNRGDDKQAVANYLRVLSGDYVFDAQLRVGVLLAMLGKPNEGLAKLEALAEEQTSWELRVRCYLAQGEVLRDQGRFKEGVEMYSRALQQNHEDVNLLYARGLMAEKVDRLDMAEADLLKVISKEPDNANALNALGYTLADRTSRYKEALEYIKRASELVPDDPAILDSLGWVSFRLGEMDEALKYLSQAFEMLEDAEIAAHYGEVLWQADQKEKARKVWAKGKANNADNPVLVETLHRLNP
jgi:tetratricopeptide (TPR) repeat protein